MCLGVKAVRMKNSLLGLIANYEMGMIINVSDGIDLMWFGERIIFHIMVDNEHVWIEQNSVLGRFVIGYGDHSPTKKNLRS